MPWPASSRSLILAWAMSRATTIGPVSITRVFTGYWLSVARISLIGRLRSMCTTSVSARSSWVVSGRKWAGSVSSCSRKMPSRVILPSAWRSALQLTAMPDRAARAVAGQADDAHVVAEVLAAELGADAGLLGELQHLALQLDVAEAVAEQAALGRQAVEVAGAGQLGGLHGHLGRRAADDDGEVVRRAGRGAERLHLLEQPRQQGRLVEQRLGLLEQVALVRAAAALGHEQELVGVAVGRRDLDLRRQVVARVALLVHVDRRHLAVAQVARQVGVEHALGDRPLVAAAGEDELALLALDDRGAGVLAHRQHAAGGDRCVLEQVEGDEAVVVAGLRVVEDVAQLLQVARAQEVGDVAHRLARDQRQRLGLDLQERALRRLERADEVGGQLPVGRGVGPQRQQLGEREVRHRPPRYDGSPGDPDSRSASGRQATRSGPRSQVASQAARRRRRGGVVRVRCGPAPARGRTTRAAAARSPSRNSSSARTVGSWWERGSSVSRPSSSARPASGPRASAAATARLRRTTGDPVTCSSSP